MTRKMRQDSRSWKLFEREMLYKPLGSAAHNLGAMTRGAAINLAMTMNVCQAYWQKLTGTADDQIQYSAKAKELDEGDDMWTVEISRNHHKQGRDRPNALLDSLLSAPGGYTRIGASQPDAPVGAGYALPIGDQHPTPLVLSSESSELTDEQLIAQYRRLQAMNPDPSKIVPATEAQANALQRAETARWESLFTRGNFSGRSSAPETPEEIAEREAYEAKKATKIALQRMEDGIPYQCAKCDITLTHLYDSAIIEVGDHWERWCQACQTSIKKRESMILS